MKATVQMLVSLCLGYFAMSGPLCERKVNVGGCNERGALEAGVATKGRSLAIEDLFWTKTILYIYIY